MRWRSYIAAIIIIVILRSIDLYVTYQYTPDLINEWNPLVSFFGISWSTYILSQIMLVALIALLMFFYFNRKPLKMVEKDLSYNGFVYAYFFGKSRPWKERLLWAFEKPAYLARHLVFSGFLAMMATIFISGFAIANNLLLMAQIESYVRFVARYYAIYFPVSFFAVTFLSMHVFFFIEFIKYRQMKI